MVIDCRIWHTEIDLRDLFSPPSPPNCDENEQMLLFSLYRFFFMIYGIDVYVYYSHCSCCCWFCGSIWKSLLLKNEIMHALKFRMIIWIFAHVYVCTFAGSFDVGIVVVVVIAVVVVVVSFCVCVFVCVGQFKRKNVAIFNIHIRGSYFSPFHSHRCDMNIVYTIFILGH